MLITSGTIFIFYSFVSSAQNQPNHTGKCKNVLLALLMASYLGELRVERMLLLRLPSRLLLATTCCSRLWLDTELLQYATKLHEKNLKNFINKATNTVRSPFP